MDFLSAFIFVRLVLDRRCKRDLSLIQSRSVGGQDLEAGTGLLCSGFGCRTVQGTVSGLCSAPADNGFYITGCLIHDYKGYLRLKGDRVILIHSVACLFVNVQCILVCLDGLHGFIFGREDKRISGIDIFRNKFLQLFF